ncbi:MAG: dihydroxyacetone kinase subunit DhaL [Spirochaetota bacterium]
MSIAEGITKENLVGMIRIVSAKIDEQKEYLSRLDTEIGDGDHGFSMANGFRNLNSKLDEFSKLDIGEMLKKCGFELIKTIGGAAGAVFGTLFTGQAAYYTRQISGKHVLSLGDIANMWTEALNQIKVRGQAKQGDKTMVDALEPAVFELKKGAEDQLSFSEAFANAARRAKEGAEKTKDMVAKRGRSKNLAERSLGFIDPGAMSTYFIISAIAEYLKEAGK